MASDRPPALPRAADEFPPEEVPTTSALQVGMMAICPVCRMSGRVTISQNVRDWCELCGGKRFVPADVAAERAKQRL